MKKQRQVLINVLVVLWCKHHMVGIVEKKGFVSYCTSNFFIFFLFLLLFFQFNVFYTFFFRFVVVVVFVCLFCCCWVFVVLFALFSPYLLNGLILKGYFYVSRIVSVFSAF